MLCHLQLWFVTEVAAGLLFAARVSFAEETITAVRTALDVLASVVVIPPPSLPMMRRLSTVLGRHGLVDFEERMIIYKLREVDR